MTNSLLPQKEITNNRHLSFSSLSKPDALDPSICVIEFGQIDKIMWQANILLSSERVEEVRTIALASQEKGQEVGYSMAIALFRLDGNKQAFEDLAVEYAVQTGNSPPVWLDAHDKKTAAVVNSAPKRVTIKVHNLTMESIIETTIKLESPWPMILDFSEVGKIDAAGLDIFQESVNGRIERDEPTFFINSEKFIKTVVKSIKSAKYQGNAGLWSFCFNAFRLTGNRSDFDDLAVDFVEKTSEDLPEWRDLRDPEEMISKDSGENIALSNQTSKQGYDLGEILSKISPSLIKSLDKLPEYISAKSNSTAFVVDFSKTKRWSIGDMSNVIAFLKSGSNDNVKFEFINLNEILHSLMTGFSVEKYAKLVVAGETT